MLNRQKNKISANFDEAEKFTKNHVMFFFNIHIHDFIVHVGPKPENV